MNAENFTKYERARILGARALQVAMNAPLLIKLSTEDLEKTKFDALKIAEIELDSDVLPISIHKPFPKKKEDKLKRVLEPKAIEKDKTSEETEEISKEGEIMELANPEDEREDGDTEEAGVDEASGE